MNVLKEKFEAYRDEVVADLDVNPTLLKCMLEAGLIDAADSAKYKAIPDPMERSQDLMTAMIERRTDRAYPLLLSCLRKSDQGRIADLLTDVTQTEAPLESDDVTHVSHEDNLDPLEKEVTDAGQEPHGVSPAVQATPEHEGSALPERGYLDLEALRTSHAELDGVLKNLTVFLNKEERRLGLEIQNIKPMHNHDRQPERHVYVTEGETHKEDSQLLLNVTTTMTEVIMEIRRCQAVIHKLHQDCQAVADVNSDMMTQTKECDAWVRDILRSHRLPVSHVAVPHRAADLFQVLMEDIHSLSQGRNRMMTREKETRTHSMRLLRICRDWLSDRCHVLDQLYSSASSMATSRYLPTSTRLSVNSSVASTPLVTTPSISRQGDRPVVVESYPITSVMEGINLLEHQIKEYVHLETLLTDKLRSELRIKQLQKKAQGYTSKGFFTVKQHIDDIEKGVDVDDNVSSLKGVLVKLSEEYDQCVNYMKRVTSNMPRSTASDTVMANNRNTDSNASSKKSGMIRKRPKEPAKVPALHLPKLVPENTFSNLDSEQEPARGKPLLNRLKVLVANYEATKHNERTMAQRFQQGWEKRKWDLTEKIRKKDEDLLNIQFRLKEMTADRDKFRKLYDQAKLSHGRKG
ncbi:uncharacterized protein LOC124133281 [Haliotis rufescens]|uniref:uncharacterized protein LOC124133281 n=1 Tax=Haliotis rufescens TaxID=6454 RepID=UPI00201E9E29|nr:uncharacterized protein LOC124133281 [Haliotis rufescens]XP_048256507.1 uncharacterized protein LOC124133281 [Haliotis rufescens]